MTPLETLQRIRPEYPTPMSKDQLGEMLNRVAWEHRAESYGLLSKPTGNNCKQPGTGKLVATDILTTFSPNGHYDCLIDANNRAIPTWHNEGTYAAARFIAPVDPADVIEPPEPEPCPEIPYNEAHSVEFGKGCNEVYQEVGYDKIDPGMISVQSQRAAWDYYVGGMSWPDSYKKHINELRAVYGLPPI